MSTDDSPEREVVVYDREGFLRAPLEDEEGLQTSLPVKTKMCQILQIQRKTQGRAELLAVR